MLVFLFYSRDELLDINASPKYIKQYFQAGEELLDVKHLQIY
jgi:hypothetical protein